MNTDRMILLREAMAGTPLDMSELCTMSQTRVPAKVLDIYIDKYMTGTILATSDHIVAKKTLINQICKHILGTLLRDSSEAITEELRAYVNSAIKSYYYMSPSDHIHMEELIILKQGYYATEFIPLEETLSNSMTYTALGQYIRMAMTRNPFNTEVDDVDEWKRSMYCGVMDMIAATHRVAVGAINAPNLDKFISGYLAWHLDPTNNPEPVSSL